MGVIHDLTKSSSFGSALLGVVEWKNNFSFSCDAFMDCKTILVDGNLTVGGDLNWRYKSTHISSYLDKIDELADRVRKHLFL